MSSFGFGMGAAIACLCLACAQPADGAGASAAAEDPAAPETVYVYTSDPAALGRTFTSIAGEVGPAVVTINSRTTFRAMVPGFPSFPQSPFGMDPWGMFQQPHEEEFVREGLGSGVIIRPDGFIVTNNHVVEGADELEVILQDGARYPADLVGADPRSDIAVIRIEADSLPVVPIGDSDALEVGQWVLAVGSPFALSQTVTQGIVSFIGRTDVGLADYESYIQTDAAINPGNSGGALVDLQGRLVGINSAIASSSGGYQGVGFAIPVNLVERVMEDLMDQGYVSRGWMGVMVQELSGDLAAEFDGPPGSVVISEVVPESPAEDAGFAVGDVITSVGGETVTSAPVFRNAVAGHDPGEEVEFGVLRDGREIRISAVLDQLPGESAVAKVAGDAEEDISELGWTLRDLDPRTADQLGYDGAAGVVITSLEPSGLAARSGLAQADVIVEVDHGPVSGVDALRRMIAASGSEALLLVWREGHTIYLVLRSE